MSVYEANQLLTDSSGVIHPVTTIANSSTLVTDVSGNVTTGPLAVTTVTASSPLSSTGGTTPDISHNASGVVAGSYTSANITVNASGHITAAANGAGGGISTVGALEKTGTADALSISGTAIRAHVGTSSTHGVGHIQTWRGASNVAIGEGCFSNYGTATANGRNTGCGFNALGTASTITTANDSAAFGSYALQSLTTGDNNTGIGSFALSAVTTGASNTACGSGAGAATNGSNNALFGASAGASLTAAAAKNTAIGAGAMQNATNTSSCVAVGCNALSAQISGISTAVGTDAGGAVTSAANGTYLGYMAGFAVTSSPSNTFTGYECGITITSNATGSNSAYGKGAYRNGNSARCSAFGTDALAVCTGNNNTATGMGSGQAITTGADNTFYGYNSGQNCTTGSNNICIGSQNQLSAVGNSNSLVIGAGATGAGSNSTVLSLNYLQTTGGGLQALQIDSVTGEIRRNTSSLLYKNLIGDSEQIYDMCPKLLDLRPRVYTLKNDPENKQYTGYIAEEVEAITGPKGNPVFKNLLSYRKEGDTLAVDGVNYGGFTVPIIALLKIYRAEIDELKARCTQLENLVS